MINDVYGIEEKKNVYKIISCVRGEDTAHTLL